MKGFKLKLNIWAKIIIPSGILVLLLCSILGSIANSEIEEGMVEMGIEEAQMAADIAVSMIDGDLVEQLRPDTNAYGDPDYMTVLDSLQKIKKTCGIEFVYALYSDDKTHLYYSVANDDTAEESTFGKDFGSPYSEFESVFGGESYVQGYIDHTEYGDLISAFLPIRDSGGKVVGILGCDYDASNVVTRIKKAKSTMIVISLVSMIVSILLLSLVIRAITRNLRKVDGKIYDLVNSEGDLTQKLDIHTGDELEQISNNVNDLLEYIREIMSNVSQNSTVLDASTGTVVESLASANDGISGVSSSMEELSATMEETSASLYTINEIIASIVETTNSIAEKANSESRSSNEISKKVQEIYNTAVRDKDEAARQAEIMSEIVNEKIECSKAVSQISALTDEILNITDQTSLLSLNASIEAARAGEAGRGFAVVASEIGSLAANSTQAAEEIQRVSEEVISAVNDLAEEAEKMLNFMNETAMAGYDKLLENSTNYRNDVESLSNTMQGFSCDSNDLRENIRTINDSVSELNIAVEESTKSLVHVTEIASDLSQSVEEISKEANANQEVAKALSSEVGKFKLE